MKVFLLFFVTLFRSKLADDSAESVTKDEIDAKHDEALALMTGLVDEARQIVEAGKLREPEDQSTYTGEDWIAYGQKWAEIGQQWDAIGQMYSRWNATQLVSDAGR